jgi:4-amino-4-deoxy-L-arabinose transferase-like glycosyltransferase
VVDVAKRKIKNELGIHPRARTHYWSQNWTLWALLVAILFFAGVRYRLRTAPLERDEGEYAYAGQLMLEGVPPYQLAYNMKLPGTYGAYAIIMAIFGETDTGIRTGLLILNATTTLVLFALARRLFGGVIAAVCGITYAALSASSYVYGLAGHATHFVVAAAVSGILLLTYALDSDRLTFLFSSGTLLGLAFLMKQPGLAFSLFGLYYFAYRKRNRLLDWRYILPRVGMLCAGVAWPFAMTCLILYRAGVFAKFWFWTFDYARAYGTIVPYWAAWRNFHKTLAGLLWEDPVLWALVICGIVALFLNQQLRPQRSFVIGLLFFSFAAVSAGFYFREHYFIMLLPVASLLCGIAVLTATEALQERKLQLAVVGIPGILYVIAIVYFVFQQSPYFFAPNADTAAERKYYGDPVLAARAIGEYFETNAPLKARLAVFGSEPEIYFYSHRHSATGYIYTYGLMEGQPYATRMQDEMVQEVASAHPEYVLFVDDYWSWLWHPGESRMNFFIRMMNYINSDYVQLAQVDIQGNPDHGLGDRARIYIFVRKDR